MPATKRSRKGAFANFRQVHSDALFVSADPFFNTHRDQIVELAARSSSPAIYEQRSFVTGRLN
jgi:putative ABC transport system substrate-binding protein